MTLLSQPTESQEILGTVRRTPTDDAGAGTRGMAPPEGSGGEMQEGEGQCQEGPSPVDSSRAPNLSYATDFHICQGALGKRGNPDALLTQVVDGSAQSVHALYITPVETMFPFPCLPLSPAPVRPFD